MEYILSFLTWKDKLWLRTMSKQTEGLIFKKQFDLILDNDFRRYLQREQCCSILDLQNFKQFIIRRFKYIKRVKILESFHNCVTRDLMIIEINKLFRDCIDHFPFLQSITYYPSLLYKNNLDEFISSCEKDIISLEIIHVFGVIEMSHLTKFKKLKSLEINSPFNLELSKLQFERQFYVQNLERASLAFNRKDLDLVKNFFQQNTNLKDLIIQSFISTEYDKHVKILGQLFHLKNLKKLSLILSVGQDDDSLFDILIKLPVRCTKITCLTLEVNPKGNSEFNLVFDRIMNVLSGWSNLKYLNLSFMAYLDNAYIKCNNFESLSGLKSFSLNVPFILNEHFLDNINNIFPNLKNLNIECIKFNAVTYNSISLCNNLEKLTIITPDKLWFNLYKSRLNQLFVNIPKLRLFKYNNNYI